MIERDHNTLDDSGGDVHDPANEPRRTHDHGDVRTPGFGSKTQSMPTAAARVAADRGGTATSDGNGWSWLRSVLFGLSHYDTPVARHVAGMLEPVALGPILEIGCGPGALLHRLGRPATGPTVTGIDPSSPLVAIARRRTRNLDRVTVDQGRAENLPYPAASFDLVVAVHSTHHWHHLAAGLAETTRVLRPGGELHVVERGPDGRWGITDRQLDELTAAVRDAGLRDVPVDSHQVGRGTELWLTAMRPPSPTPGQDIP